VNDRLIALLPDEIFRFECSPRAACFNACCRDLNQFLYPYDILRLKKRLGLSSGEFLQRYTKQHIGPQSGLPVVSLTNTDFRRLDCPFLTAEGCSVYSDRPASCRIYPVVRAISHNRSTGEITEHFMLLKEPHCLGFGESKEHTVRQWINEQDVAVYNHINDRLMEIVSLKNRLQPGPLDLKSQHLYYMALYDLDNFRNRLFNNRHLDNLKIDPQKLAAAETDDTALLKVGIEYVKKVLLQA
jgi:Fe-S-cluster containining protein